MKKNKIIIIIYFFSLAVFSWWTWILTAPNLVLSSWSPYWHWQTWMWQTFYANRSFISFLYLILTVVLFLTFFFLVKHKKFATSKNFLLSLAICCLPLCFSFNALSFDVFNYLFNAKMVVTYQTDPHQHTALEFSDDQWTRFMHNTHTAAPYGRGWTLISLVPFCLAFGKFTPAWLLTRFFSLALFFATFYLMSSYQKKIYRQTDFSRLALFFFNPLVLIELIVNMHNDLWMMFPALWSLLLIYPISAKQNDNLCRQTFISLFLLAVSCSIKYATLALIPVWLIIFALNFRYRFTLWLKKFQTYIFDLAALMMFLPLLTSRSQLFHPWYLLWSFTFIPFVKTKLVRQSLLILSFSSLLRYFPNLLHDGFGPYTLLYQQLITLVPFLFYLVFYYGRSLYVKIQK